MGLPRIRHLNTWLRWKWSKTGYKKTSSRRPAETLKPVSSRTSRTIAPRNDSPFFTWPPGKPHKPRQGSLVRFNNKTRPSAPTTTLRPYTTTMPSEGVGGLIFDVCDMDHCSDGVRNCGETGVDCGGDCPDCTPGITGRFVQIAGGGLLLLLLLFGLLVLFIVRRRKKKESEA